MKPRVFLLFIAAALIAGLVASPVFAQQTSGKNETAKPAKQTATKSNTQAQPAANQKATKGKKAEQPAQTPPQPGMVWANTQSKVYHKEGDRWYGRSKNGKWMTEEQAKAEGYKEAGTGAVKKGAGKKAAPKQ